LVRFAQAFFALKWSDHSQTRFSKPRGFDFPHELVETAGLVPLGEKLGYFHLQDFREEDESPVIDIDRPSFDFGNRTTRYVPPGDLQFGGKNGLRPRQRVPEFSDLRANIIFESHISFFG